MDQYKDDHVSLLRTPRKWYNRFAWIFILLVIGYLVAELAFDWSWHTLSNGVLERVSVLMTIIVGLFFIVSHLFRTHINRSNNKIRAEVRKEATEELINELLKAQNEGKTLRQFAEQIKNTEG